MLSVVLALPRICSALLASALALSLCACSITLISPYSKEASDRVADLSKDVLALYQDLLMTDQPQRHASVGGPMKARHAAVETKMRLHLLQERARAKNTESIKVAENMLATWRTFGASHAGADVKALTDATLEVERQIMERHLGAALQAEEAKKLAGS